MPRKPGKRGKTRSKFRKRGVKASVNDMVREFSEGDIVQIVIDPSQHAGMPDKSFQGLTGRVSGKRGSAFEVKLRKGNQDQMIVTTAVHLKGLKQEASSAAA